MPSGLFLSTSGAVVYKSVFVYICNSRMGCKLEEKANKQQTMCWTWQNWNSLTWFNRFIAIGNNKLCEVFLLAHVLQKQKNISGRPSKVWVTFCEHTWKCWQNYVCWYEDCQRTIQDIGNAVNVLYGTGQTIFTSDLNMYHIVANFVLPRILIPPPPRVYQDLHQQVFSKPTFMLWVITGEETWFSKLWLQDLRRHGRLGSWSSFSFIFASCAPWIPLP